MLREVFRIFGQAVCGQVGRTGADDVADHGQAARDQAGILQVRDADGDVEAFLA